MSPWIRWTAEAAPAEPAWRWLAQSLGMPALLATPARPRTGMVLPPSRLSGAARQALASLLGERLHMDDETRIAHIDRSDAATLLRQRGGDLSPAPDAVLYPRSEAEVLALLQTCAQAGIAVGYGKTSHAARAICDLSGMADILSLDAVSGLVTVQAGISSAELAKQLAVRGMTFGPAEFSTLGQAITQGLQGVTDARLTTPQGTLSARSLPASPGGLGIVTAATLRIRALPAATSRLDHLFPDFASGLAAAREIQRESVAQISLCLSDAEETRFLRRMATMAQPPSRRQRLTEMLRSWRLGDNPSALRLELSGSAADVEISRKRVAALAARLGARRWEGVTAPDYRPLLLNRGVTVDSIRIRATWSGLPVLYAALRAALDQAMRLHAPRAGAHGLVLAQLSEVRPEGADLTCTFLFARQLNDDVIQAQAVRQAAQKVMSAQERTDGAELRRAIKAVVDPKAILAQEGY